jgi:hypothetical protein
MGILNETILGVPVGTLVLGMAIIVGIVWLWSRWDERKSCKRPAKRAEYQASLQDGTRVRTRVMEEAKKVLQETRLPASMKGDRKGRLDLSLVGWTKRVRLAPHRARAVQAGTFATSGITSAPSLALPRGRGTSRSQLAVVAPFCRSLRLRHALEHVRACGRRDWNGSPQASQTRS